MCVSKYICMHIAESNRIKENRKWRDTTRTAVIYRRKETEVIWFNSSDFVKFYIYTNFFIKRFENE